MRNNRDVPLSFILIFVITLVLIVNFSATIASNVAN